MKKLDTPNLTMEEIVGCAPKFVNFVPTQSVLNQLIKKMKEITCEEDADDLLWKGFDIVQETNRKG
jgi:hypothetical protein